MNNPFEIIEARLTNIENLLLDIKHAPKDQAIQPASKSKQAKKTLDPKSSTAQEVAGQHA
jgi:hypothetical protein